MRAHVYFRIGVPFENGKWFETVKRSAQLRVVDMREGLALREMASHAGAVRQQVAGPSEHVHSAGCEHGGLDPHVWLAPGLLKQQAATVLAVLQEMVPDRAAEFKANFEELVADLDALDVELRATLGPLRGASLYVYHPSWGYFCDAYGLRQRAIEVEGKEPSDAELTALQAQARSAQVKVLFVQPQIEGRSAQALAKLLGAEVRTLDPLVHDVIAGLRSAAKAIVEGGR
jgi:zinc transport system substrate-binding protein